ncbi:MAG: hypothetical protein JWM37_305 [Candidatus Saccharibacteria bacterium]|nr:hypothetical protein [Candidatus Saccharibacteria bacterium]
MDEPVSVPALTLYIAADTIFACDKIDTMIIYTQTSIVDDFPASLAQGLGHEVLVPATGLALFYFLVFLIHVITIALALRCGRKLP